jgi:WD40 repeat protein
MGAVAVGALVSALEAVRARHAVQEQNRLLDSAKRAQASEAKQKLQAQELLYKSLVAEAREARLVRRSGYRNEMLSLLKQAQALEVPEKNVSQLRSEAVACLDDFIGLSPAVISNFPGKICYACLAPSGKVAAFALWSGAISVREVPSGSEQARFDHTNEFFEDICFNSTGDELFAKYEQRFYRWAADADGHWHETETRQLPPLTTRLLRGRNGILAVNVTELGSPTRTIVRKAQPTVIGLEPVFPGESDQRYVRIRLLDTRTEEFMSGYEVTNPVPHSGEMSFCFSTDGRILAVQTKERDSTNSPTLVNVYDWAAGVQIAQMQRSTSGSLASSAPLALSDDGKYLLNLSEVGATLYGVPGLEIVAHFDEAFYGLLPLVFRNIVALPAVTRLRLWDLAKRQDLAVLDPPPGCWPAAFSSDVSSLLLVGPYEAQLHQLSTPERLGLASCTAAVPAAVFSPDGLTLASVSKNGLLRVFDAGTGRILWQTNNPPGLGQCLAFSPDGHWLAVGFWDSDLISIRDAETGRRLLELGGGRAGHGCSVQFSPDGRYLATTGDFSEGTKIWTLDCPDGQLKASPLNSCQGGGCLLFAPDSRSVAFTSFYNFDFPPKQWGDSDRPVYIWDFLGSAPPRRLASGLVGAVECESFAPGGRQLVAIDARGDIVTLDVATGRRISAIHAQEPQIDLSSIEVLLSPDGSKLAITVPTPLGAHASILDPKTGKLLYSLPGETGSTYWAAWSPDSRRLAIARDTGNVAIWDLEAVAHVLSQLGLSP